MKCIVCNAIPGHIYVADWVNLIRSKCLTNLFLNLLVMSSNEEISEIIKKYLPSLSDDRLHQLLEALQSSGVECVDDLKHVGEKEIQDVLPNVQTKKLIEGFKKGNSCLIICIHLSSVITVNISFL